MSEKSLASVWMRALDDLTGSVLGFGKTVGGCLGYICSPYNLQPLSPIAAEEPPMLSADPYTYINTRAARQPLCCGQRQLGRRETYLPRYSMDNKLSHRRLPENVSNNWTTPEARRALPPES